MVKYHLDTKHKMAQDKQKLTKLVSTIKSIKQEFGYDIDANMHEVRRTAISSALYVVHKEGRVYRLREGIIKQSKRFLDLIKKKDEENVLSVINVLLLMKRSRKSR